MTPNKGEQFAPASQVPDGQQVGRRWRRRYGAVTKRPLTHSNRSFFGPNGKGTGSG